MASVDSFAETLKNIRTEKGFSQQQLASKLFVDRSSVAKWENGSRFPDAIIISRIAKVLDVDVSLLLESASVDAEAMNVIVVDDENILLAGAVQVITEVLPEASVTGFTNAAEAMDFFRNNRISLAFLDIELGKVNGLTLCNELLEINPLATVIFFTSYPDYALKAWDTRASGFLVKPLTVESVSEQLEKLRFL
ncbi:MAG: response regulator [Lachnospiraceae bacterium]|nr:response regulator [Lachnospiraceae bacterium]